MGWVLPLVKRRAILSQGFWGGTVNPQRRSSPNLSGKNARGEGGIIFLKIKVRNWGGVGVV